MPKVPTLSPEITPVQAPRVAEPVTLRPPAEAFGAGVQEARAASGDAAIKAGQMIGNRIIEHQQRDDENDVLQKQTQFQADLQNTLINPETDTNDVPKGLLNRQLGQTKGATVEYDQTAQQLKAKYLDSVNGPDQKEMMAKILDNHLINAREQVIRHEADQRDKDFRGTLDTSIKINVQNAASLSDPASVTRAIQAAQISATSGFKHLGLTAADAAAANRNLAGQMVQSAVSGVLEQDPKAAQAILAAHKDVIPATTVAELQKTIDGKLLYNRIQDVTAVAQNFRMADGMIDRSKVDAYVKTLKLPPEQEYQLTSHVEHLANIDYSEQMKRHQDAERSLMNDAVSAQSKGVPYNEALKLSTQYGWDPTSTANMQAQISKLYENPQDKFDYWINKQPQEAISAWSDVQNEIKNKFPKGQMIEINGQKRDKSEVFTQEMKNDLMGKTADQMRDIAKAKMEKVAVGPASFLGIPLPWNSTEVGAFQDAKTKADLSAANIVLERSYGAGKVNMARAKLAKEGKAVTPSNLNKLLGDPNVKWDGQE